MTMKQSIFTTLVTNGKQKTAAQMAAQHGTTVGTVTARISEIRDAGFAIYANQRTDSSGRTKVFYRHGAPRQAVVQAGRALLKALGRTAL